MKILQLIIAYPIAAISFSIGFLWKIIELSFKQGQRNGSEWIDEARSLD